MKTTAHPRNGNVVRKCLTKRTSLEIMFGIFKVRKLLTEIYILEIEYLMFEILQWTSCHEMDFIGPDSKHYFEPETCTAKFETSKKK